MLSSIGRDDCYYTLVAGNYLSVIKFKIKVCMVVYGIRQLLATIVLNSRMVGLLV